MKMPSKKKDELVVVTVQCEVKVPFYSYGTKKMNSSVVQQIKNAVDDALFFDAEFIDIDATDCDDLNIADATEKEIGRAHV